MHKLGVRPEMTIIKTAAKVGPDVPLLAPPLTNFNAPWHNPPKIIGGVLAALAERPPQRSALKFEIHEHPSGA